MWIKREQKIKDIFQFAGLLAVLMLVVFLFLRGGEDRLLPVSGTLEATTVNISSEVGGQVADVLVKEGEGVKAGEVLLRFEDEILNAERHQAETTLRQAVADYQLIATLPLWEQRQVKIRKAEEDVLRTHQENQALLDEADQARAEAEEELEEYEQALEDLLDPALAQAKARNKIAAAIKKKDRASRRLKILTTTPSQEAIDQAYANVLLAKSVLNQTQADLEKATTKLQGNLGPEIPKELYIDQYKAEYRQIIQVLERKLSQDQLAYEHALERYNLLLGPPDPVEVALAEAALAIAEAELGQAERELQRVEKGASQADISLMEAKIEKARSTYEALKNGPDPDDIALANARIRLAEANYALAQVDTRDEQLAVARARIKAAEAALEAIEVELRKLVVTAPIDGIMLDRAVETGEVVKPGTTIFILGQLDQLTLTIYLPEEIYPTIQLDDRYDFQVDAIPNTPFNTQVVRIAGKDEFRARNTIVNDNPLKYVFPVKLIVDNPDGILKPGMLANLNFGSSP